MLTTEMSASKRQLTLEIHFLMLEKVEKNLTHEMEPYKFENVKQKVTLEITFSEFSKWF